jgi:uncharacterized membrane protein
VPKPPLGLLAKGTRALLDHEELIAVAGYAVWAALLALGGAPLVIRLPFGLLAVLFLPGFALAALAFPRGASLNTVERLALALGLSLSIVSVVAVMLDRSPVGMTSVTLTIGVSACTLHLAALAGVRRAAVPPDERFFLIAPQTWHGLTPVVRRGLSILAGATLLSAVTLAVTLTAQPPPLTQFYALGPDGKAEDYPRSARAGEPVTLTVGIENRERRAVSYRVSVVEASGPSVPIGELGPIDLVDGNLWEAPISFILRSVGKDREVQILLYRGNTTEPYRRLRLWLDVLPR